MLYLSIALLAAGCGVAFVWFYFFQPLHHEHDDTWRLSHTDEVLWHEIQSRVRHYGWMHDDFGWVGMRGGKEWAEWVVWHIRPDENLADCDTGHKDGALEYMTNQSAGYRGKDWIAWWEKNKDKTQEEWIRDGFAARGVDLHRPLDDSDTWRLLLAIGSADDDKDQAYRFNAARLILAGGRLRKLNPDLIPKGSEGFVLLGLRDYNTICQRCLLTGPRVNADLGLGPKRRSSYSRPWIAEERVANAAYGIMGGLLLFGGVFMVLFFRRRGLPGEMCRNPVDRPARD